LSIQLPLHLFIIIHIIIFSAGGVLYLVPTLESGKEGEGSCIASGCGFVWSI